MVRKVLIWLVVVACVIATTWVVGKWVLPLVGVCYQVAPDIQYCLETRELEPVRFTVALLFLISLILLIPVRRRSPEHETLRKERGR